MDDENTAIKCNSQLFFMWKGTLVRITWNFYYFFYFMHWREGSEKNSNRKYGILHGNILKWKENCFSSQTIRSYTGQLYRILLSKNEVDENKNQKKYNRRTTKKNIYQSGYEMRIKTRLAFVLTLITFVIIVYDHFFSRHRTYVWLYFFRHSIVCTSISCSEYVYSN